MNTDLHAVDGDATNIAADHEMFITLTGELSWQRLRRSAVDFYSKNEQNCFLSHPLGHLWVTYALHLWLVGKPVVNFIFVVIELFRYVLRVETLWAEIGRSRRFSKGVGRSLWAQISEGRDRRPPTATNRCWCQSKRVIDLSRGIKISAVHHLDLSQSTRVTDGRTELRLPILRPPSHMLAR